MSESVQLDLLYGEEDFKRALRFLRGRSFIIRYALALALCCFALSLISYIFAFLGDDYVGVLTSLFVVGMGVFFIFGLILLVIRFVPDPFLGFQLRRQIKSSPLLGEVNHITIDSEGLKGETKLGSQQTAWAAFIEIAESREDYFFFTSKKFAIFIPKRAIDPAESHMAHELIVANYRGPKLNLL